jgi:hypothetical protein
VLDCCASGTANVAGLANRDRVDRVQVVLNNNYGDQGQRNATTLIEMLGKWRSSVVDDARLLAGSR